VNNRIYQVDAFADKVFSGNPASVCSLEKWLPDVLLQKIAMENNQAETCFYVRRNDIYEIRWFTPTVEVDLCGHATLAAAQVIFAHEKYREKVIRFFSPKSGYLNVTSEGSLLALDFPTDTFEPVLLNDELIKGFSVKPLEAYKGKTDYVLVYEKEDDIKGMKVDLAEISKLRCRGVIITAKGDQVDFVSRFFAPQSGIPEDPVTGSAHTTLTPYWSLKLAKSKLTAAQLSARGGQLFCENKGERTIISGYAHIYLIGEIFI